MTAIPIGDLLSCLLKLATKTRDWSCRMKKSCHLCQHSRREQTGPMPFSPSALCSKSISRIPGALRRLSARPVSRTMTRTNFRHGWGGDDVKVPTTTKRAAEHYQPRGDSAWDSSAAHGRIFSRAIS